MAENLPNIPIRREPTALRIAIAQSGMTQRYIAQQVGISEAHLSRIVNGLHVHDGIRTAIARVLDRQLDELFPPDEVEAA